MNDNNDTDNNRDMEFVLVVIGVLLLFILIS